MGARRRVNRKERTVFFSYPPPRPSSDISPYLHNFLPNFRSCVLLSGLSCCIHSFGLYEFSQQPAQTIPSGPPTSRGPEPGPTSAPTRPATRVHPVATRPDTGPYMACQFTRPAIRNRLGRPCQPVPKMARTPPRAAVVMNRSQLHVWCLHRGGLCLSFSISPLIFTILWLFPYYIP